MSIINILLLLCSCLFLSSCAKIKSYAKPYVIDVQQGNIIESSQINQLQTGMNKDDVVNILGTPILNSFENDNWVYIYTNQINGGTINKKEIEITFVNNIVVKIRIKNSN